MIAFIAFEYVIVFTRKHPQVSIKEILNDMDNHEGGMSPFHYGFDIAVGLQSRMPEAASNAHRRSLSSAA